MKPNTKNTCPARGFQLRWGLREGASGADVPRMAAEVQRWGIVGRLVKVGVVLALAGVAGAADAPTNLHTSPRCPAVLTVRIEKNSAPFFKIRPTRNQDHSRVAAEYILAIMAALDKVRSSNNRKHVAAWRHWLHHFAAQFNQLTMQLQGVHHC